MEEYQASITIIDEWTRDPIPWIYKLKIVMDTI